MTKLHSTPQSTKQKVSSKEVKHNLDTLAQLGKPCQSKISDSKAKFQKASRRKRLTNAILTKLVPLNSPLQESYIRTAYCNEVILQEGSKVSRRYCNNRWCLVCNSIRTAKAINGYKKPLQDLGKIYFFTLTIKSVKAKDLRQTITKMYKAFRDIHHNVLRKKYKIQLKGLRKFECNYNEEADTFNPHIHFVLSGTPCQLLLIKSLWLNYFPNETDPEAQNIEEADEETLQEMFKYFTKIVVNSDFNPIASDIIFRAMKGKRVYQSIGIKRVSEEVEMTTSEDIDFQPKQVEIWKYQNYRYDWVNSRGQAFCDYKPLDKYVSFIDKIESS
jgi:hypothetical protein